MTWASQRLAKFFQGTCTFGSLGRKSNIKVVIVSFKVFILSRESFSCQSPKFLCHVQFFFLTMPTRTCISNDACLVVWLCFLFSCRVLL